MICLSFHGRIISKIFIARFLARGVLIVARRCSSAKRRTAFTSIVDSAPRIPGQTRKARATRRDKLLRAPGPLPAPARDRCLDWRVGRAGGGGGSRWARPLWRRRAQLTRTVTVMPLPPGRVRTVICKKMGAHSIISESTIICACSYWHDTSRYRDIHTILIKYIQILVNTFVYLYM